MADCFYEKPKIFKNVLSNKNWESIPWNWKDLVEKCGSIILHFRIVPKFKKGTVWESDAQYIEASIEDFINWLNHDPLNPNEYILKFNPFASFSLDQYWIYSSYNSVNVKFPENNAFRENLNWSLLGLHYSNDRDSSFWIGSDGAYTPCHVDTYGFNLVAQIIGRKRWILFPPEDNCFMYPTRIPYEESSIFSSIDIIHPNLKHHPLFQNSHPHVVVLEPGDVLLVPGKWWHFVQCIDHSVSVNTWTPLPSDDQSRLMEAVAKILFSALCTESDPYLHHWINPAEEITPILDGFKIMELVLSQMSPSNSDTSTDIGCSSSKIPKLSESLLLNDEKVKSISCISFSNFLQDYCSNISITEDNGDTKNLIDLKSLVNCFLHPDVITCICTKLKALKN